LKCELVFVRGHRVTEEAVAGGGGRICTQQFGLLDHNAIGPNEITTIHVFYISSLYNWKWRQPLQMSMVLFTWL